MTRVGICGSYGGLNVGDEAILTAAIDELRTALPGLKVCVFTRDVPHTTRYHDVDRVVDARRALRDELAAEVKQLDLLLLGGGGILYDREAECYLHLPRIAQSHGVPTATYAIGAGPLERSAERRAVAEVLNGMHVITVRDTPARRLLEEIGVHRDIVVTADPALLLAPAAVADDVLGREGVDRSRRLVGVSVREPGGAAADLVDGAYHRLLAYASDFIAARFEANVVFVPMERQDINHAYRVIAEMGLPQHATVLTGTYGPRELLRVMGRLEFAVGMRLHFAIFAALNGVPVLGLPYASKVSSFLESIGVPPPGFVQQAHAGVLLAAIDRMWDVREEQRERLRERVPALKQRARQTTALVVDLIGRAAVTAA